MASSIATGGAPDVVQDRELGWPRYVILSAFSVALFTLALRHVSPEHFALFWDDALFFKRVAYNIVQHGFAGWNQADGPLFVNTSQLFQLIATALLRLFPGYYNAAVTFWGALSLSIALPLLNGAARAGVFGAFAAFFMLQAPPIALSLTTGMETPSVILVLAFFLYVLLRSEAPERSVARLAGLQVLVYAVRPDALLMSFGATLLILLGRAKLSAALRFAALSLLGVGLLSLAFYGYYGTAVPLSTFLKISPFSAYDADYLSRDSIGKAKNLAHVGLAVLALSPLIALRRDRTNVALIAAALGFIGYHALTTYEIAAYHARFYAPALPFVFAAALRGVERLNTPKRALWVVGISVFAAALTGFLYARRWIESGTGYAPEVVTLEEYARFFIGPPLLGLLALAFSRSAPGGDPSTPAPAFRSVARNIAPAAVVAALALFQTSRTWPESLGVVTDEDSNQRTIYSHSAVVGIEPIQRCFAEPLTMTHTEIGLPGVLFLESRIIDMTGLANREVVQGTFDFDALCSRERPEFIFRPHWSHVRLNQELNASACLAQNYTKVALERRASCPLLVRNDLLGRYKACRK